MKRLLIQGLKFLAVCVALYLLAFFVLTRTHIQGRPIIHRTSDYYQGKGGVVYQKFLDEWNYRMAYDAIVIGSSHAYRGYDPRVFAAHGYHMFNLGSTAQTPLSTYVLLKHYVDSARCGLVIIDLYENAFVEDGLESVSDLSQNLPSDVAAAELTARFLDLRALNMFTLRMMNKDGPPTYRDSSYKGAGFAIKSDSLKEKVVYDKGRALHLNERQQAYFIKCLDLCRERGIRVVLATHFYPHQSDRARHAAFAEWVSGAIEGRGIRWFDLAYDHTLSDRDHFCDHNHMNEAGARIFNERLLDSLVANGYLPTR